MHVPRWLTLSLVFAACTAGGYVLVRSARVDDDGKRPAKPAKAAAPATADSPAPVFHSGDRPDAGLKADDEAATAGAIPGQRFIVFPDQAALERFLAKLKGKGITVLGRLDGLHALRIGFFNAATLNGLLDGSEKSGLLFPVLVPDLPQGSVQAGAVGLGGGLLSWLGVANYPRDTWGSGVMVAVLDTGISGLAGFVNARQVNLVDLPSDISTLNGHGTAVASLILQIAPAANVLSIRVADDLGSSNSWLLAQGIVQAVDYGAQVINISMGSYGDSALVKNAVEYAQSRGAVVVAASGNEGLAQSAYPAAYDGVVAVGAVDARGDHLLFSNSASNLSLVAPGYGVYATGTNGETLSFSGTSASTPIAAGALAASMSNDLTGTLSANDALGAMLSLLDESGAPGNDPQYGGGALDLKRVVSRNTPGIVDAAVASHWVEAGNSGQTLEITVQNQGTAAIYNAELQVNTPSGTTPISVSSLNPGQTRTYTVPVRTNGTDPMTFQSNITLSGGQHDANPANNRRADVYTPSQRP